MDSFLTLSNLFKQFQSFNQIIPAAYLKSAMLNSYKNCTKTIQLSKKTYDSRVLHRTFLNIKQETMISEQKRVV